MEQTSIYNLNQWVEDDRILREDFNADNAKIEAALANAGNCKIVTGSYVGNNAMNRVITLPFTPKVVILLGYTNSSPCITVVTDSTERYLASGGCNISDNVCIVENGFQVALTKYYWFNENGLTQNYIALY